MEEDREKVSSEQEGLEEGVYYASTDYAGLFARFVIIGVDLAVLCLLFWIIIGLGYALSGEFDSLILLKLNLTLLLSYVYLVIIKRSDWGTVGYRLTGVRIVSIEGRRPSIWQMTLRLLFLILGPFNFLLDILWLSGDDYKQALRDKIAGTYVVRHDAVPMGRGEQLFVSYFLLGWNFVFREVKQSSPR